MNKRTPALQGEEIRRIVKQHTRATVIIGAVSATIIFMLIIFIGKR